MAKARLPEIVYVQLAGNYLIADLTPGEALETDLEKDAPFDPGEHVGVYRLERVVRIEARPCVVLPLKCKR